MGGGRGDGVQAGEVGCLLCSPTSSFQMTAVCTCVWGRRHNKKKKKTHELGVPLHCLGFKGCPQRPPKSGSQIQTRACWQEAPAGPLAPVSLLHVSGSSACLAAPIRCPLGSPSLLRAQVRGVQQSMTLKRGCVDGSGAGDGTNSRSKNSFGEDQAIRDGLGGAQSWVQTSIRLRVSG